MKKIIFLSIIGIMCLSFNSCIIYNYKVDDSRKGEKESLEKKESESESLEFDEEGRDISANEDENKEDKEDNIMQITLKNGIETKVLDVDITTHPVLSIELNNDKMIELVLLPEVAENTVNNMISLAQAGFYDGLIFHRIIKNFMIQGGCPEGSGMGNPGYSIKAEFVREDGYILPHTKGVISMARSRHPNSAGSQFFIMHKDAPHLDGDYASFGIVLNDESMAVVDEAALVSVDAGDRPLEDLVMKKVTVELNGYEPKELEKIER